MKNQITQTTPSAHTNISIFNFYSNEVRTAIVNGEPYFCLKDICQVLDITNYRNVLLRLTPKGVCKIDTLTKGGVQKLVYISESNLYKVIFKSNKKEALKFEEWVTSEVLPSIRKTGNYVAQESPYSLVNKHSTGFNNLNDEANYIFVAKANLFALLSFLESQELDKIIYQKSYRLFDYSKQKRVTIPKQTIKDFLQTQINTLAKAFNIMYQPYYKHIVNIEHNKKYKELQAYLAKKGGCTCH